MKVEGEKEKTVRWIEGEAERVTRCSLFLLWAAEVMEGKVSHGSRIRNVNRLSQSRAGTVWKERVSTPTEGHTGFGDCHWSNGSIMDRVFVRVRVARRRMWDWLSLLSIMNG